jgi:hypothetical protein
MPKEIQLIKTILEKTLKEAIPELKTIEFKELIKKENNEKKEVKDNEKKEEKKIKFIKQNE